MRQRVTVVLVARNGGGYVERTLGAVAAQTRRPDTIIAVDAASRDDTEAKLAASAPTQLVSLPPRVDTTFGAAVAFAVRGAPHSGTPHSGAAVRGTPHSGAAGSISGPFDQDPDSEWLWLLRHDSAPAPDALEQLLRAVEIAPSVAVAGPKAMAWDRPDVIDDFGESMTRFGSSVRLVEGELDQAQHDVLEDVLGVAANGMLVRRSVWEQLGGFDPGLQATDAGLDFSIRARLAGHRVIVVPGARVSSAGGPELWGRDSVSAARSARLRRRAQLHRRLVYAPAAAVPLHWLMLVPLAFLRSVGLLLAKHPHLIGAEFAAAFAAAFDGGVVGARRKLGRTKRTRWRAIAPLRVSIREVRERRAQAVELHSAGGPAEEPRIGYLAGGGLWLAAFAGVVGVIALWPLLGAQSVVGGGLLPLSATPAELWANVGVGWRNISIGFEGAADPFATVLAVLGSITFWSPSLSIVVLYLLALPIASAGAWFAARKITPNRWVPLIAGALWALAPPLLSSLQTGHLGAVIAHLALPWLVLATIKGARSLAAAAAAGILFAVTAASAPSLVPALLVLWLAWMVASPRGIGRLIGIPILTVVMFVPLAIAQLQRATPLALFADPGVPTASGASSSWHVALLSSSPGLNGWADAVAGLGLAWPAVHIVVAVLLAPVGVLALLAPFLRGSARAVAALVVAMLGFATAIAAGHLAVTGLGAEAATVWPGAGLSLFWLGLVGAAIVALAALPRASVTLGIVAVTTTAILAGPLLGAMLLGWGSTGPGAGRIVPAVVAAEARTNPHIGTLMLTPAGHDALDAELQRGSGTTLDEQSTLHATNTAVNEAQQQLATLAGNLASRGNYDPAPDLASLYVGFVVLADAQTDAVADPDKKAALTAVHERTADSLDGNPALIPVGQTAVGELWRVATPPTTAPSAHAGALDTVTGKIVLGAQGFVFIVLLLLAVPTRRRRKVRAATISDEPATTFDEDSDD